MTENTTPKLTLRQKAKLAWYRHERKILVTATVASTTVAVITRTGIAQHNAFLKEKGLYEEFYALNETIPTEV